MKRLSLYSFVASATLIVFSVVFRFAPHLVHAQMYTPKSITEVTNIPPAADDPARNPFGTKGCVWRGDLKDDGTIQRYEAEPQAPAAFYKQGLTRPPNEVCDFFSANDWLDFQKNGESALWPLGCFNPVNIYYGAVYGSFQFNKNYDNWDELYYALMGATNKRKEPAAVAISFGKTAPQKGEEESFVALPFNYSSPTNKNLFGWSRQKLGQNFISQQGIVAGGREITQVDDFRDSTGQEINTPECKRVTRDPKKDGDRDDNGDGMGDRWEMQYFGTLNVDPEGDKDHDGIVITDKNTLYDQNLPRLVPAGDETLMKRVPAPDPDAYLGIRVTPDTTAKDPTGNGNFTNMEEWIWGTNPLDPDTDDDGFPDEADVIGLGQNRFSAPVNIDAKDPKNDRETYRVATVGVSTFLDEENSGHKKVMIASEDKVLTAGNGDNLRAQLMNMNEVPSASDVQGTSQIDNDHNVIVEADISGTDVDKAALLYSWFVEFKDFNSGEVSGRVQVPPTEAYSLADISNSDSTKLPAGKLGKYIFHHPITELTKYVPAGYTFTPQPGSMIYVTVDISNTERHEAASKRIPVSFGTDSTLDLQITDLNTGKTQTAEEYALEYCRNLSAQTVARPAFCSEGRVTLNQILPWLVFSGSKVTVTAAPLQTAPGNVSYRWWLNDEPVAEDYGASSQDNKLVIYPTGESHTYNVRVQGYTNDRNRAEVFSAQVDMKVVGPTAAITATPASVAVGDTVTFTGQLTNFPQSLASGFDWEVAVPGGEVLTGSGKSFAFAPQVPGPYTATLSIQFQTENGGQRVVKQSKTFVIGSPRTVAGRARMFFASARTAFAQNAFVVYEFSLIAFGVLVVVLTTLRLVRAKKK